VTPSQFQREQFFIPETDRLDQREFVFIQSRVYSCNISIGNIRVSVFMHYILKSLSRNCREKFGKFGLCTNSSAFLIHEDGASGQLLRAEFLYHKNRFCIREPTRFLEKLEQPRARDYCEIASAKVRASWSKNSKRELSEPVNESVSKGIPL
jgi:hypothetical protein